MKLFILLVFTHLWNFYPDVKFTSPMNCSSLEIKVVTTLPNNGESNGEIKIEVKGASGQLHYFFFSESGYPLNSKQEKLNFIKNLKAGKYKCTVADDAGCAKLIEIDLTKP